MSAETVEIYPRITVNPHVMAGKPCIRGMRVTFGMILGQLAAGHSRKEILGAYPYLEADDITASLEFAAWRFDGLAPTPLNSQTSVRVLSYSQATNLWPT